MKIKKIIISLLLITLNIYFYFKINAHIPYTIHKVDDILSKNGINNYCKNKNLSQLDASICKENKFKKFILLYYDSLPLKYLTKIINKYKNNLEYHKLIQKGMEDSAPFMNSIFTGVQANKYEGNIRDIDNIFNQYKINNITINAKGNRFPFEEMVDLDYFHKYEREKNNIICDSLLSFKRYEKNIYKNIKESFIFGKEEEDIILNKFLKLFNKEILENKEKVYKCLEDKLLNNEISYFYYTLQLDLDGHKYTGQSGIFIAHTALILANLDILFQFIKEYKLDDLLVGIISDHGVNDKVWMMEFFNHGTHKDGNEAFISLFSTKFNYNYDNISEDNLLSKYDDINSKNNINSVMLSTQAGNYLLNYISNCNYLINNLDTPVYPNLYKDSNKNKLLALRSKEIQIIKLINYNNKLSPFLDLDINNNIRNINISNEFIVKYENYINNLILEQKIFYKKLFKSDNLLSSFYMFVIFMLYIFRYGYKLKKKRNNHIIMLSTAIISIFIYFYLYNDITVNLFICLNIILLIITSYNNFSYNNLSVYLLLISAAVFLYDYIISTNFNYYFIYYNVPITNIISIIIMLLYTPKYNNYISNIKIKDIYALNVSLYKSILLLLNNAMILIIILYEIFLLFHYNIVQNIYMMYLTRTFIIITIIRLLFSFNLKVKGSSERLIIFEKILFWICTAYQRLSLYLIIFPIFYYIKKHNKISITLFYAKYSKYSILIFYIFNLYLFFILRGGFDCEISTRAAFRNWNIYLETNPSLTAIFFFIQKFIIFFIIPYIYIVLFRSSIVKEIKLKTNKKVFTERLYYYISNNYWITYNFYFGLVVILYLKVFDNPVAQRKAFMYYISTFLVNILLYLELFIIIIYVELQNFNN